MDKTDLEDTGKEELHLIFLGAPGAGKGTIAKKLCEDPEFESKFFHLSTGDLLRDEIKAGTKLGKKVKGILDRGELVEERLIVDLVSSNCNFNHKSYVLDGFPRTINQAKILEEEVLQHYNYLAFYFDINLDVLLERLENRRVCSKCGEAFNLKFSPPTKEGICNSCDGKLEHRSDDVAETIKQRMDVFLSQTSPLLNFYEKKHKLIRVNSSMAPQEVYEVFKELLLLNKNK